MTAYLNESVKRGAKNILQRERREREREGENKHSSGSQFSTTTTKKKGEKPRSLSLDFAHRHTPQLLFLHPAPSTHGSGHAPRRGARGRAEGEQQSRLSFDWGGRRDFDGGGGDAFSCARLNRDVFRFEHLRVACLYSRERECVKDIVWTRAATLSRAV